MAHVTGLAAARWHVLDRVGWDVGRDGLHGAPRVRVLVGAKRHVTVDRALRLLGLGAPTVVDADGEGRMLPDALRAALGGDDESPTIVCAQAGEVNTGAFDPLEEIAPATRAVGGWLHVDGAFVPEFSRRARGFAVYAALRSLGRRGLVELIERCCAQARKFADGLASLPGAELLNEVVLNQVLFRFETDERTDAVLRRVQADGRVWMSGTTWDGRKAIRISVSNWQTDDAETDLALQAFGDAVGVPVHAPAR